MIGTDQEFVEGRCGILGKFPNSKNLFGNTSITGLATNSCELTELIAEIPALPTADGQMTLKT